MEPEELVAVYEWVDSMKLSRPKSKNFARDFSDGVLIAEVVQHYIPKLIDMHNYIASNNSAQKRANWECLASKVFKRLKLRLSNEELGALIECKPQHAERLLQTLQTKLEKAGKAGTGVKMPPSGREVVGG